VGDLRVTPFGWGTGALDYENNGNTDFSLYSAHIDVGSFIAYGQSRRIYFAMMGCAFQFDPNVRLNQLITAKKSFVVWQPATSQPMASMMSLKLRQWTSLTHFRSPVILSRYHPTLRQSLRRDSHFVEQFKPYWSGHVGLERLWSSRTALSSADKQCR